LCVVSKVKRLLIAGQRLKGAPRQDRLPPERIVWIFGSARTGSTRPGYMMGELEGHAVCRESLVGALLGDHYYLRARITQTPLANILVISVRSYGEGHRKA